MNAREGGARGAELDEGTADCSVFEMVETPIVTAAAQASSGMVPADRGELEVVALKQRLQQGQSEFLHLRQTNIVTLAELQKGRRHWEEATVALRISQQQVSELKSLLDAKQLVLEQGEKLYQEAHLALAERQSRLQQEGRKRQQDFQQNQILRKEEAETAERRLQKALVGQKQKLEQKQEQRLKQTRADAAGALETARRLHQKELMELQTVLKRQQQIEQAVVARREQGKDVQIIELRKELKAAHTLEAELNAANSLAAVSAAEQLPGLGDAELRELEEAVRKEYMRRQQLTLEREREELQREREEMRKTMMAELERERALQREEREEAIQCAICLDRDKDTALNCGHQACAQCAIGLANCHICRGPITTRTRLY
jgi:hypothetical protein